MKKINKIGTILIALLIVSTMIACVRPASTQNNVEEDYESVVDSIIRSAETQTAIAEEGVGGGASLEDELTAVVIPTEVVEPVVTLVPTEVPIVATPIPTPVELVPITYTLQEGEHPYCIARRFDVEAENFLLVNGIGSDEIFLPGFELIIPQNSAPFAGVRELKAHPVNSFAVSSGDTFNSIACFFGDLYPESIAAANAMEITDTLVTGSSIIIP